MRRKDCAVNISRRHALCSIGAGVVGTIGTLTTTPQAAAEQTEWKNDDEEYWGDGWGGGTYHGIGAGLKLKNDYVDESGDYVTVWELSGDGVVNDRDKEFPGPDGDPPSEVDKCPRKAASAYSDHVRGQGFIIEVPDDLSIEADFADSDEMYMFPEDCSKTSEEAAEVAYDAAVLAANACPLTSGLIAGAELADSILELYTSESGTTYDLRNWYGGSNGGLLRGGFGIDELKIIADDGDYGTVDVFTDFGEASTGFEIYIQYDGFGGPQYDVTKK